ncbi:hypothetical protein ACFYN3_36780 [Streptomyces lavendulae]
MIHTVWIPLLVPFLVAPAGRRLATNLPPRQATDQRERGTGEEARAAA